MADEKNKYIELQRAYDELKREYDKLTKAHDQLLNSEKMSVIGKLSSSVAHQLRNPLSIIDIAIKSCLKNTPLNDEAKENLEIAKRNVKKADRILHDLLHLSKPQPTELKPVLLFDILENVTESIDIKCENKGLVLEKKYGRKLPIINADSYTLEHAFMNFLMNSVDATSKGGKLIVEVEINRSKKEVLISFIDTGKGIDKKNIEKIFDPFFTTKEDGIGLGLFIAKEIIEAHNGRIAVENNNNHGTIVKVILPLENI